MTIRFSRRQFISSTGAAFLCSATYPWEVTGQTSSTTNTRLILLGTGGGPRPRKDRFASSQVIVVNNGAYVVEPADDAEVTEQMWVDAARSAFKGQIIVDKDLLEI